MTDNDRAAGDAVAQTLASDAALDNFDRAFSHMRTNRFRCECGQEFWDSYNSSYDWAEGERESLVADPNAVACEHAIDVIDIEGREYANSCGCWRPRASRIIKWLENHRTEVATFLRLEKERLVQEAMQLPTVD